EALAEPDAELAGEDADDPSGRARLAPGEEAREERGLACRPGCGLDRRERRRDLDEAGASRLVGLVAGARQDVADRHRQVREAVVGRTEVRAVGRDDLRDRVRDRGPADAG